MASFFGGLKDTVSDIGQKAKSVGSSLINPIKQSTGRSTLPEKSSQEIAQEASERRQAEEIGEEVSEMGFTPFLPSKENQDLAPGGFTPYVQDDELAPGGFTPDVNPNQELTPGGFTPDVAPNQTTLTMGEGGQLEETPTSGGVFQSGPLEGQEDPTSTRNMTPSVADNNTSGNQNTSSNRNVSSSPDDDDDNVSVSEFTTESGRSGIKIGDDTILSGESGSTGQTSSSSQLFNNESVFSGDAGSLLGTSGSSGTTGEFSGTFRGAGILNAAGAPSSLATQPDNEERQQQEEGKTVRDLARENFLDNIFNPLGQNPADSLMEMGQTSNQVSNADVNQQSSVANTPQSQRTNDYQQQLNRIRNEANTLRQKIDSTEGGTQTNQVEDTPFKMQVDNQVAEEDQRTVNQIYDSIAKDVGMDKFIEQRTNLMKDLQAAQQARRNQIERIQEDPDLPTALAKRRIEAIEENIQPTINQLQNSLKITEQQIQDRRNELDQRFKNELKQRDIERQRREDARQNARRQLKLLINNGDISQLDESQIQQLGQASGLGAGIVANIQNAAQSDGDAFDTARTIANDTSMTKAERVARIQTETGLPQGTAKAMVVGFDSGGSGQSQSTGSSGSQVTELTKTSIQKGANRAGMTEQEFMQLPRTVQNKFIRTPSSDNPTGIKDDEAEDIAKQMFENKLTDETTGFVNNLNLDRFGIGVSGDRQRAKNKAVSAIQNGVINNEITEDGEVKDVEKIILTPQQQQRMIETINNL